MAVTSYRDLIAWQKAMELVLAVYRLTKQFPPAEQFGLTTQVRRAAVSVAANIAEGQGRGHAKEFARYLDIANGSRQEVETHLEIATRLEYVRSDDADLILPLAHEVGRLIRGLQRSIGSE